MSNTEEILVLLLVIVVIGLFLAAALRATSTGENDPRVLTIVAVLIVMVLCIIPLMLSYHEILDSIHLSSSSKQNAGIIFSILGLWLSGAGVIGKKRLEQWDANLHSWLSEHKLTFWAAESANRIQSWLYSFWWIPALAILGFAFFWSLLMNAGDLFRLLLGTGVIALFISLVTVPIIFIVPPFLPYILLATIEIITVPFRLVNLTERQAIIERTLLLAGLIFGTAGILLLVR